MLDGATMKSEVNNVACVVTSWKCPRCSRPIMLAKGDRIFVIGCNVCNLIVKGEVRGDNSKRAIEDAVRDLVEMSKGVQDGANNATTPAVLPDLSWINNGSR